MKKGFTADYWFLAGIWALSGYLLPFLLRQLAAWLSSDPTRHLSLFTQPEQAQLVLVNILQMLAVAFSILASAAYFLLMLRFSLWPFLPVYLLRMLGIALLSLPGLFTVSRVENIGWIAVVTSFVCALGIHAGLFALTKPLLRLTRQREWLAYLLLLVVYVAAVTVQNLLFSLIAYGQLLGEFIPIYEIEKLIPQFVAYWLLYFCAKKWWSGKKAALPEQNP